MMYSRHVKLKVSSGPNTYIEKLTMRAAHNNLTNKKLKKTFKTILIRLQFIRI